MKKAFLWSILISFVVTSAAPFGAVFALEAEVAVDMEAVVADSDVVEEPAVAGAELAQVGGAVDS